MCALDGLSRHRCCSPRDWPLCVTNTLRCHPHPVCCRVDPALAALELLYRPAGRPYDAAAAGGGGSAAGGARGATAASATASAAVPCSATQLALQAPLVLSIAFLEEKGNIKAAYTEQRGSGADVGRTPGRQRRLSRKRQLDSSSDAGQLLTQPEQQQGPPPADAAAAGAAASGGGRKRRRTSSTAAAHGARGADLAGGGAAGLQARSPPPSDAGSRPAVVSGWGVDEGAREFSCRTRRGLLLYLKVGGQCAGYVPSCTVQSL